MKFSSRFSFLVAVASGVFWGTYGTFARLIGNMGIGDAMISLITPLFLMFFFLILVVTKDKRRLLIPVKMLPIVLLYGFIGAVFYISVVKAYLYLPIGIVSTMVYCNLFLLMVFSYFLFKEPMTRKKFLAALLAVIGISMVLNIFSLKWSLSLVGIMWALLAMTSWAVMVVCEKYMLLHDVDGNVVLTYNGFFSLIFISLLSPTGQTMTDLVHAVIDTGGIVLLPTLGLGLVTSVACYFCYINALKYMDPAYVQIGFIMDPTTSCILGFIVFGQVLMPIQIAGIILVLVVVLWVQWDEENKVKSKQLVEGCTKTYEQ